MMKLIECHIAGFGTFKDYKISFDDGLNVILQPNGWGKTTLAAFIKAMLYGFGRKRVRDVAENERLRYMPWGGGSYGGSLDFGLEDTAYRVLRTFGKTASGDTLQVMDIETGEAVDLGGSEPGEWFFGLDANAFQKSVFVGQNGFSFDGSAEGIRAKLGSLVGEADDAPSVQDALAALEQRRKYYLKRGQKGRLADISQEIEELVGRRGAMNSEVVQVGQLDQGLTEVGAKSEALSTRIADLQQAIESAQELEKEVTGLKSAHDQLAKRRQETVEALESFRGKVGDLPGEEELQQARNAYDEIQRLEGDISQVDATLASELAAIEEIRTRYGGHVPQRDEIASYGKKLEELTRKKRGIERAESGMPQVHPSLEKALKEDPSLIERAETTVGEWPAAKSDADAAKSLQNHLDARDANWKQGQARVASLARDFDAARSSVPEHPEDAVERYRDAARDLRSISVGLREINARKEELERRITDERDRLGALSRVPLASEEDLADIDGKLAMARDAEEQSKSQRLSAREESERLARLKDEAEAAAEDLRAAQVSFAEAEAERASAISEEAKASSEMERTSSAKGGISGVSLILVLLGVILCLVGAFTGPASAPSFALYAAGIILIVISVIRWTHEKAQAGKQRAESEALVANAADALRKAEERVAVVAEERDAASKKADDAQIAFEAQKRALETGEAELDASLLAEAEAKQVLTEALRAFVPDFVFESETVLIQAPAVMERIVENGKLQSGLSGLEADLASLDEQKSEKEGEARNLASSIGLDMGEDLTNVADAAMAKAASIQGRQNALAEAEGRLLDETAALLGRDGRGDVSMEDVSTVLRFDEAPGEEENRRSLARAQEVESEYRANLMSLLEIFGVEPSGSLPGNVERLSAAIADCRSSRKEAKAREHALEEERESARMLADDLVAWGRKMRVPGSGMPSEAVLTDMSEDVDRLEKHTWAQNSAHNKLEELRKSLKTEQQKMDLFLSVYGVPGSDSVGEALERLESNEGLLDNLARDADLAYEQLTEWEEEHGSRFAEVEGKMDAGKVRTLKQQLDEAQGELRRTARSTAQIEQQRSAILGDLEDFLGIAQKTRLLSLSKQEATAKLFTVQKTADYLNVAHANLDQRYLGGLAERFNDYVGAWLQNDNMKLSVDSGLDVKVAENGSSAHDAVGYSTGYLDLFDVCLRMALVDIIFEEEKPFVVMDDPFVNLDQENVGRALTLLALVSKDKQIVYFTCHPSRFHVDGGLSQPEFTLPQVRKSLETPRARARREAEERARAQAELVAAYHVVPVTQGRSSLTVEPGSDTITNNLFYLRFKIDPDSGSRDNAFETYFIDQQGRSLCERQIVEVVDGEVVPERLRFCLNTHVDSGKTYDLILHEQGREDSELADRVPFKADISFSTDDFVF